MNLYLRFFDNETLATSLIEVYEFLQSIPEITMDEFMMRDIEQFVSSSVMYPKRYKVSARAYFIIIKTTAKSIEEFKAIGAAKETPAASTPAGKPKAQDEVKEGWYEGTLFFKRVVPIGQTQKSQYVDTEFKAQVRCSSPSECYNRIVSHLRTRQDVDPRSQIPSMKGRNFVCTYLGEELNRQ